MWMQLVTAIPVIGWIMILVWAFVGENESRKNYYKAILAWILIVVGSAVLLMALGSGPDILKHLKSWTHKA
jgi:hypothetical protein